LLPGFTRLKIHGIPDDLVDEIDSTMPLCKTKYFNELEYQDQARVEFQAGLPGFESERQFILIERPDLKPLVFVQSLATPDLCFLTLPVLTLEPDYRLAMSDADRQALGLRRPPAIGRDVACLAILNVRESGTVVNLLAPLVIDLRTQRAVQAIVSEGGYSHEHPLGTEGVAKCL
jgi:flagellar assembly factor FliW